MRKTLLLLPLLLAAACSSTERRDSGPHTAMTAKEAKRKKKITAWRESMDRKRTPGDGCYVAVYPGTAWKEAKCVHPPDHRQIVGGGFNTILAQATGSSTINKMIGSFTNAAFSEVDTSDKNQAACSAVGAGSQQFWTLQTNTNYFSAVTSNLTFADPNFKNPCTTPGNCHGWMQFVLQQNGPNGGLTGYIEYWLMGFQAQYGVCPAGFPDPASGQGSAWHVGDSQGDCVGNSGAFWDHHGAHTPADLENLQFIASSDGTYDYVSLLDGTSLYKHHILNALGLNKGVWNQAEFNIFGDGDSTCAIFSPNPGSSLTVQDMLEDSNGNPIPGQCVTGGPTTGTTGETNSLNLVTMGPPSNMSQYCCFPTADGIFFTESNDANPACTCPSNQLWNQTTKSCGNCPYVGQYVQNGKCVCAPGMSLNGKGKCACPTLTVWNGHACAAPPCSPTCVNGCWGPEELPGGGVISPCKPTATPGQPGTPKYNPQHPEATIPTAK